MRLEDYTRLTIEDFRGLWDNGAEDTALFNYFLDCLNLDYEGNEVSTRPGLNSSIVLGYGAGSGKVRRFINFISATGQTAITLILDEAGKLYRDTSGTVLITVAGAIAPARAGSCSRASPAGGPGRPASPRRRTPRTGRW